MTGRKALTVVLVVVVATTVVAAGSVGTAGAATGVSEAAVTPSTVTTGDAVTLSISVSVAGVDTSDGTTGGTVTFSVPDAVDLTNATATNLVVSPNASGASSTVDPNAGTVTVSWDDDSGVTSETLSIDLDIDGVVVARTGEYDLSAAVDADATSGAELSATVGTVTASASESDRSLTGTSATMYLGEQNVDLTGLTGVNAAGNPQQFYGVSGEAEGSTAEVDDTLAADVSAANRFQTGGYAASSGADSALITVVRPRVTDVSLSPGTTSSSVDVANGSVPRDTAFLTVTADYNFADAEGVTVTVEDEAGVDVTPAVTDSSTIVTDGGSTTLNLSTLDVGAYTVTVEGADDLDNASRTVSVRIRDAEKVISLSKNRVVRGESSIVSVAGAPGDVRYVRIDADALREGTVVNTPTARALFDDTEAVQTVGADADRGVVYAVVSLDDDGLADLRLQTAQLDTGSVEVELVTGLDGSVEDDVTLEVFERTLTVDELDATAVGESVTVSGRAAESDRVKLYAAVDDSYVPLYDADEANTPAEADVESGGSWAVDVDTARVVDLPGTYRVVAVADPGASRLGSVEAIDSETLRTFDVRGSASLTTVEGSLSMTSSRTTIAATGTDEFTLSGTAVGQSDELRLYHVGPRGDTDLTLVDERDGAFEQNVAGVDTRGTHTYIVVGAGRDGAYAYAPDAPETSVETLLSGRETPTAAIETITDAYTGAGSDDPVVVVDVQAVDEDLSITAPTTAVTPTSVSVTGTSTSEDGTTVFVELEGTSDGAETTRFAETSVTNGTWNATLDLAGVDPGSYRLSAETGTTRASQSVELGTERRSPTPQSTATPSDASTVGDEQSDATAAATASETPADDTATTSTGTDGQTTDTQTPGFGGVTALGALALGTGVIVLGSRRRRET